MPGSPVRVLLVEDYLDALEVWSLFLRSRGYEVITASDGPTGFDLASSASPDVVIMDLELPGMTGFEAARRLRAANGTATLPLIAATGYSHVKQLESARQAGFDAILVKPCDPEALIAEIERVLGSGSR